MVILRYISKFDLASYYTCSDGPFFPCLGSLYYSEIWHVQVEPWQVELWLYYSSEIWHEKPITWLSELNFQEHTQKNDSCLYSDSEIPYFCKIFKLVLLLPLMKLQNYRTVSPLATYYVSKILQMISQGLHRHRVLLSPCHVLLSLCCVTVSLQKQQQTVATTH